MDTRSALPRRALRQRWPIVWRASLARRRTSEWWCRGWGCGRERGAAAAAAVEPHCVFSSPRAALRTAVCAASPCCVLCLPIARRVNCPFYFKIGACRHGDRCSRNHMRPQFSTTLVLPHMYIPMPPGPDGQPQDDTERFEDFYQEVCASAPFACVGVLSAVADACA